MGSEGTLWYTGGAGACANWARPAASRARLIMVEYGSQHPTWPSWFVTESWELESEGYEGQWLRCERAEDLRRFETDTAEWVGFLLYVGIIPLPPRRRLYPPHQVERDLTEGRQG